MKLFFVFSTCFIVACEAFKQAPPATSHSGISIGPSIEEVEENPTDSSIEASFGDVRCHPDQRELFNNQVKRFLSTTFNPSEASYTIKCHDAPAWKGGFYIRGKVSFDDGQKFDTQSQTQSLQVSESSYLEIYIRDITDRSVPNVNVNVIKMAINTYASTYVSGQNVTLVFNDNKGNVTLEGSVKKNQHGKFVFSGAFKFNNSITWTGAKPGYSGSIGTFIMPACNFFECTQ